MTRQYTLAPHLLNSVDQKIKTVVNWKTQTDHSINNGLETKR